jgi:hypothetical protein
MANTLPASIWVVGCIRHITRLTETESSALGMATDSWFHNGGASSPCRCRILKIDTTSAPESESPKPEPWPPRWPEDIRNIKSWANGGVVPTAYLLRELKLWVADLGNGFDL